MILNTHFVYPALIFPPHPTMPLFSLKHPGDEPVRDSIRVPFPVLGVLAAAAVLVPDAAVDQQDGHVNDVEVGQYVSEAAGGAVRQRAHQVTRVVEVPGHAPEA